MWSLFRKFCVFTKHLIFFKQIECLHLQWGSTAVQASVGIFIKLVVQNLSGEILNQLFVICSSDIPNENFVRKHFKYGKMKNGKRKKKHFYKGTRKLLRSRVMMYRNFCHSSKKTKIKQNISQNHNSNHIYIYNIRQRFTSDNCCYSNLNKRMKNIITIQFNGIHRKS